MTWKTWAKTPLAQRMLLISMGDSLQGGLAVAPEIVRPTAQQLYEWLHDPPVVSVEIFGPESCPDMVVSRSLQTVPG